MLSKKSKLKELMTTTHQWSKFRNWKHEMLLGIWNRNFYSVLVGIKNGTATLEAGNQFDSFLQNYIYSYPSSRNGTSWCVLKGVEYFSSVQLLSRVRLFVTPWITACQASMSITNSWSSPRLTSIKSVMPSRHLILCRPLLLLSPIPPSIRVFSNESTLHMRWPKYWSFSFSIILSKEIPGLISFRMDWWISLQSKGLSRVFSNTTIQKH